jgi:hypothetical protein
VLSSGSVYRVPEVEWWVLLIPATMANPAEMIGGWPNDTNETVVRFSNKEVKKVTYE